MIGSEVRASLLGSFPLGTPVLIAASGPEAFRALVDARSDPAILVTPLAAAPVLAHPALGTTPHLVLEGLDDLEDPLGFLTALRSAAPQARLFVLVANGAHVRALSAFVRGSAPARAHPLVERELEALFGAAGWQVLATTPVADAQYPPPAAYPADVGAEALSIRVDDAAAFARVTTAAFVVVADSR